MVRAAGAATEIVVGLTAMSARVADTPAVILAAAIPVAEVRTVAANRVADVPPVAVAEAHTVLLTSDSFILNSPTWGGASRPDFLRLQSATRHSNHRDW